MECNDAFQLMKEVTANQGYYTQQGYSSEKLRELTTTRIALHRMLKEVLHPEVKKNNYLHHDV
jgi:hypothetical protein